jgi:hypothetical protein
MSNVSISFARWGPLQQPAVREFWWNRRLLPPVRHRPVQHNGGLPQRLQPDPHQRLLCHVRLRQWPGMWPGVFNMSGAWGSYTELGPLSTRTQTTRISDYSCGSKLISRRNILNVVYSLCEFINRRLKGITAHYIYLSTLPSACILISGCIC